MNPNSLIVRYKHLFPELKRLSRAETVITEENVYQIANPGFARSWINVARNILPNSDSETCRLRRMPREDTEGSAASFG
jgi:hypothetical protein